MWLTLLLCLFLVADPPASETKPAPRFEDFPAAEVFRGPARSVDLSSYPEAGRFRTSLRAGAHMPPDFGGKYRVVTWGCGTDCHTVALVDLTTGRVHMPMIADLAVEHRADSYLLVIDPESAIASRYGEPLSASRLNAKLSPHTKYYLWDDHRKKLECIYVEGIGWRPGFIPPSGTP
jgi:hypothetical protein